MMKHVDFKWSLDTILVLRLCIRPVRSEDLGFVENDIPSTPIHARRRKKAKSFPHPKCSVRVEGRVLH